MADRQHIEILIELLSAKAKNGLKSFNTALNKSGVAAKKTGSQLRDSRGRFIAAGKSASKAAFGVGLFTKSTARLKKSLFSLKGLLLFFGAFTIGRKAIATVAEFGQAMSTVKAITQATAEEFQKLEDRAKALGSSTRFSATEAASGMVELARAGLSVVETIEVVDDVLMLAQAGALDLASAAKLVGTALKVFKLEAKDATKVADVLATAANAALTDVNDLGEAFKYAAVAAKASNISFEETTAALTVLADAGLRGSAGGTALRIIMSKLAKPTATARKALKEMGLTMKDVDIQTLGFTKVMENMATKSIDLGKALELFEIRGGPAFLALVQNVPALQKMLKVLGEAEGNAARFAWEMDNNVAGALKAVSSAYEGFTLQVLDSNKAGNTLKILLKALADGIRSLGEEGSALGAKLSRILTFAAYSAALFIDAMTKVKLAYLGLEVVSNAASGAMRKGILSLLVTYHKWERGLLKIEKLLRSFSVTSPIEHIKAVAAQALGQQSESQKRIGQEFLNSLDRSKEENKEIIEILEAKIKLEKDSKSKTSGDRTKEIDTEIAKLTALIGVAEGVDDKASAASKKRSDELRQKITELNLEKSAVDSLTESMEKYKNAEAPKPPKSTGGETELGGLSLDQELALFDEKQKASFKSGTDSWQTFWDERLVIMQSSVLNELMALDQAIGGEKDLEKQEELLGKRNALTIKYNTLDLANETAQVKAKEKLDKDQLQVSKVIQEQIRENELQAMTKEDEARARKEDSLKLYHAKQLQIVTDAGASLAEKHQLLLDQEVEREQLKADQVSEIKAEQKAAEDKNRDDAIRADKLVAQARMTTLRGTEQAFAAMYEASGKKIKAFFILQKAAAIASTIMMTYESAIAAYKSMVGIPIVGPALGAAAAAIAVAGGLANVAIIARTSMATGGPVPGHSPTDSADNIPANLTAGEYVQPVSTVKHYGQGVMEALRNKTIPREAFSGFSFPSFAKENRNQRSFASGGAVAGSSTSTSGRAGGESESRGITINNIVDTSLIDQHLLSPAGQETVMNIISSNAFGLELLMKGNM